MTIFWNWSFAPTEQHCYKVADQLGMLYCFHQQIDAYDWRVQLAEIFQTHLSNGHFLILMHENNDFPPTKQQEIISYALQKGVKAKIRKFSGGIGPIYFHGSANSLGLLNVPKRAIAHNHSFLFGNSFKKVSVLNDQNEILVENFLHNWAFYYSEAKKLLFEAREHFLWELHKDSTASNSMTFKSFMKERTQENSRLEQYGFIFDKDLFLSITSLKEEDYQEIQPILNAELSNKSFIYDLAESLRKAIEKIA